MNAYRFVKSTEICKLITTIIKLMYKNLSTTADYPKTLIIRNHYGGMIWQIYHVQKEIEAIRLAENATKNAFEEITLENYQPNLEETWQDWRETCDKSIIE